MDERLALYEIAAEHKLDSRALGRLQEIAGLGSEPRSLAHGLPRGIAVLAAALAGLGIVFWIAANWDTLGRVGQFALLQGCVLVTCLAALWRPVVRLPMGLLALLAIGGLFAYFGQTYQTGADAWQLFALWAALALPLCLGARSDVLWAPWALVAMTAVALWVTAHTGHQWRALPDDLGAHLIGWAVAFAVVAALGSRRVTGAGIWALRTALTPAVTMVTLGAIGGLFSRSVAGHYGLGLALLVLAAVVLARPRSFEVFGLSAVALGINALLVAGLARLLFENRSGGEPIGELLLIGLAAAGLLAATVAGVLRLAQRAVAQGEPA